MRQHQVAHEIESFTLHRTDRVSPPTVREALSELVKLLEKYGPAWYTEEHHNRATSALRQLDEQSTNADQSLWKR